MGNRSDVWRVLSYSLGVAAIGAAAAAILSPTAAPLSAALARLWPGGWGVLAAHGRLAPVLLALFIPMALKGLLRLSRPRARNAALLTGSILSGGLLGAIEPALLMGLALILVPTGSFGRMTDAGVDRAIPVDAGSTEAPAEVRGDGALTFDAEGTILAADATARRMLGGEPVGKSLYRYLPRLARSCPVAGDLLGHRFDTELQHESSRFLRVEAAFWASDGRPGWRGQARLTDVSKRAERLVELERLALHDALTGLPNRSLFGDRVRQAIAAAERHGQSLAVMLLDLDRFKQINDTLGHATGDRLLQAIGPRLSGALRKSDTLARLGGDEFAVLLPRTRASEAKVVAGRIRASIAARRAELGAPLDGLLSVSMGIADLEAARDARAEALFEAADEALYTAKQRGRDRVEMKVAQIVSGVICLDEHRKSRTESVAKVRG